MVVAAPKLWPASVTPLVAVALGAVSLASVALWNLPGMWTASSCAPLPSFVRTTRTVPSVARVAHTSTPGMPVGVTLRRRDPGGVASANINMP